MARDLDAIVEAMKAVLCPYHFELDPDVPPIPFQNQVRFLFVDSTFSSAIFSSTSVKPAGLLSLCCVQRVYICQ